MAGSDGWLDVVSAAPEWKQFVDEIEADSDLQLPSTIRR